MKVLLALGLICFSVSSFADTHVNGYYRQNGTYVQPHMRTDANDTKFDNYNTKGNTNPYTGKEGTVDPYQYNQPKPYTPPSYQYNNN